MTSPPGSQNASPARMTRGGCAFQLEQHLALQHVAESRATRMPVRRGARTARRVVDDNGHGMCAFRDERRLHFLHNRQRVLPLGVILLRHRSFLLVVFFRWRCRRHRRAGLNRYEARPGEARKSTAWAISSGSAVLPPAAALLPRRSSRPVMMTEAPSRASSSAHARPMPAVPPVINAVWSINSIESSKVYATWASAMRSRCRPRDARDMTVPCGMPRIAAVSA